tara:strand:+ start:258 stop:866 length:609 start_codon:yes stop_codon:yes gene_type:complete
MAETIYEDYESEEDPLGYGEGTAAEKKAKRQEAGKQAARARAGRRAMFAEGGEQTILAGRELAEDVEKSGQVGVSKALAVAPGTDIRALAGLSTEAQVGADVAAGTARKEAAVSMMDVSEAVEKMGTDVEDYAAKKAELTKGMYAIIEKHKGDIDDDEYAMWKEIKDMIKDPTIPPDLVEHFTKKANSIWNPKTKKAGSWNV